MTSSQNRWIRTKSAFVRKFLALRSAQRMLKERADELERLQRAKAELTRMIVHDLKTRLRA